VRQFLFPIFLSSIFLSRLPEVAAGRLCGVDRRPTGRCGHRRPTGRWGTGKWGRAAVPISYFPVQHFPVEAPRGRSRASVRCGQAPNRNMRAQAADRKIGDRKMGPCGSSYFLFSCPAFSCRGSPRSQQGVCAVWTGAQQEGAGHRRLTGRWGTGKWGRAAVPISYFPVQHFPVEAPRGRSRASVRCGQAPNRKVRAQAADRKMGDRKMGRAAVPISYFPVQHFPVEAPRGRSRVRSDN